MDSAWEKYANDIIRQIAGDIEKARGGSQEPDRPEHPTPKPSDLSLPVQSGQ